MSSTEVFRRIIAALNDAGIPSMLTGSFASSFHGLTRATQDIDLVIAPTENQLRELVGNLPPEDFYVDLGAALEALRHKSQFNVIDLDTGWKVDLIDNPIFHSKSIETENIFPSYVLFYSKLSSEENL